MADCFVSLAMTEKNKSKRHYEGVYDWSNLCIENSELNFNGLLHFVRNDNTVSSSGFSDWKERKIVSRTTLNHLLLDTKLYSTNASYNFTRSDISILKNQNSKFRTINWQIASLFRLAMTSKKQQIFF